LNFYQIINVVIVDCFREIDLSLLKNKHFMKKIVSILALAFFTVGVVLAQKGPIAKFSQTEINYGTIEKSSNPLRVFEFKNTGNEPLIIKNAKGSCGCTVPTYPKEPIMPGKSSKIEVRYDTERVGPFTKSITLTTNEANETRVLIIKGEVKSKKDDVKTASETKPKGK
jgi:hypothetical protein